MPNFIDLTGQSFGLLTVISRAPNRRNLTYWNCLCECGSEITVYRGNLKGGGNKSCGCWRIKITILRSTTHGMAHSTEYESWCKMKARCTNPNNNRFNNYGGRGITICNHWFNSFENFFADMGKKPSHQHSIDRIDNDGNYEPGNCRWATPKQQANNRRLPQLA